MTLERIEHKVFASEAPLDEMGQFGSALATTKLNTKDVAEIQALPAYTKGWGSAIISENNYPAMEEMNGVLNVMSYHTGYLYQEGIPVYSSTQTYSATSWVKTITGEKIYKSKQDENKGHDLEDADWWEELKLGGGGSGLQMFDTILKDHVLTYEESKGLALQGTYVYKEAIAGSRYGYPDFYNKCIQERNTATATQITLSGSTITMYIASNGHQYYDIANKDVIDTFFGIMGSAWFYGVDTANERIFLPRNNYFDQATGDVSEVGQSVEAGLPNITGGFTSTALNPKADTSAYGAFVGTTTKGVSPTGGGGSGSIDTFDASRSNSTYGNSNTVQPNAVKKLLYICVGNTESKGATTEVIDVTTTENDTTPLFTGMYFDFKPNNVSWLIGGGQANNAGIYATCYNELVNVLNGETKYGDLKVVNEADMIAGVDYSEYWKVNQDNMTFTTPLLNGSENSVDYSSCVETMTTGAVTTSYTAPKKGFITYASVGLGAGGTLVVKVNGKIVNSQSVSSNNYATDFNGELYVNKDDFIELTSTYSSSVNYIRFFNLIGNGSLYFKVANAVQNLELLNAGEVLEAVNGVIPNNSSLISSYAMPSGKYIDLTLGASGTDYTAPANGYFGFYANAGVNGATIRFTNKTRAFVRDKSMPSSTNAGCMLIEALKGDVVNLVYTTTGNVNWFRFMYTEGSKQEV